MLSALRSSVFVFEFISRNSSTKKKDKRGYLGGKCNESKTEKGEQVWGTGRELRRLGVRVVGHEGTGG